MNDYIRLSEWQKMNEKKEMPAPNKVNIGGDAKAGRDQAIGGNIDKSKTTTSGVPSVLDTIKSLIDWVRGK